MGGRCRNFISGASAVSQMQNYKNLIRSKSQEIQSIESSLRSLSYILPGRFKILNSFQNWVLDFRIILVYSLCNVFSLINASILGTDDSKYLLGDSQPSPHNRYTKSVMLQVPDSRNNLVDWENDEDSSHKTWLPHLSYVLAIIRQCEIILEMAVLKWKGDDARWKLVGIVESIKCMIKTIIFNHTQNRLLLVSSVLEPESFVVSKAVEAPGKIHNHEKIWTGKRTGIKRPYSWAVQTKGINYLLSRAVSETCPKDMVKPLNGLRKAVEYLYIFRPLIYLALVRKCEKSSWKPWLISIGLELFSLLPSNGWIFETPDLSLLEADEIKRRQRLLLFYLLKSPFYQNYSKSVIDGVVKSTETTPLISIFSSMIKDYQPLWENYHFYTNCGL